MYTWRYPDRRKRKCWVNKNCPGLVIPHNLPIRPQFNRKGDIKMYKKRMALLLTLLMLFNFVLPMSVSTAVAATAGPDAVPVGIRLDPPNPKAGDLVTDRKSVV